MIDADITRLLRNAVIAPARPMAYFAGAGVSIDSGLPNFWAFGKHIIECVTGRLIRDEETLRSSVLTEKEISSLVAELRPEVLLQTLFDELGGRIFEFYNWLEGDEPNPNHEFLARAIEKGHLVFTTNVDNLIESAYQRRTGKSLEPVVSDEDYAQIAKEESWLLGTERGSNGYGPGLLLKLHGTIDANAIDEGEKYKSLRFLLNQVGHGLTSEPRGVLKHCLETFDFAFVGYSGCDHFSVQPVLRDTETERTAYWFWFDTDGPRVESDIERFRQVRDEIGRKVADGTSYADIPRGMETYSTCEILAARTSAHRWFGNPSQLLAQIVGAGEFKRREPKPGPNPEWLIEVTLFDRLICAAKLFRRANETAQAERFCQLALEVAKNDDQTARANRLLGDICLVSSVAASDRQAARHLTAAIDHYTTSGQIDALIDAKLESANVFRRMKEYPQALATIEEVDRSLEDAHSARELRDRVAARLYLLHGLILGLSGSAEVADKAAAVEQLKRAVVAAGTAGLVATKCSALNSLGLVAYQLAGASEEKLREAEGYLRQALELNTFTGDARACFQQLRNLGLVHAKLAQLSGDPDVRRAFLEDALADYLRAERFLERLPKGGAIGEILETRFRAGEALIGLNRKDEAEQVLADVRARRLKLGDWHNEARTLELLLQTTQDAALLRERLERVYEIYQTALRSSDRLKSFETYPIRLANAASIVDRAVSIASAQGLTELALSLQQIRTELDRPRKQLYETESIRP